MTTYHLLLAVHLVLAVFVIGPLVHAATTAGRGIRLGDATATASASRVLRIYSYASVLVLLVGIPLMRLNTGESADFGWYAYSSSTPRPGVDYLPTGGTGHLGEFSQTWIWLSIVLWVIAMAIVLGLVVPTLDRTTKQIGTQESVAPLTARVAAGGGVVGLLFIAVVVLMVYRPGR